MSFQTIKQISLILLACNQGYTLATSHKDLLSSAPRQSLQNYSIRESKDNNDYTNIKGSRNLFAEDNIREWEAIGNLTGTGFEENYGEYVSISSDGTVLVASGNEGVLIYEYNFDTNSYGTAVPDDPDNRGRKSPVAISNDGKRLAVGSPYNIDNGSNSGKVRVLERSADGSSWDLVGSTLVGDAAGDLFGYSVAISSDGSTLVIGAITGGYVKVYEYNTGTTIWDLKSEFTTSDEGNGFGFTVAISGSGDRVVISAPLDGNSKGFAEVYEYDDTGGITVTKFEGRADEDEYGQSLSISLDGTRISIGTSARNFEENQDYVQVFESNALSESWNQIGGDLEGDSDAFGGAVSLSEDGNLLAVGAERFGEGDYGIVKVYEYDSGADKWLEMNDKLSGLNKQKNAASIQNNNIFKKALAENCGRSVSVSSDARYIAYGCPGSGNFQEGAVFVVGTTAASDTSVPSQTPSSAPSQAPSQALAPDTSRSPSSTPSQAPSQALGPNIPPSALSQAPSSSASQIPSSASSPSVTAQPSNNIPLFAIIVSVLGTVVVAVAALLLSAGVPAMALLVCTGLDGYACYNLTYIFWGPLYWILDYFSFGWYAAASSPPTTETAAAATATIVETIAETVVP